MRIIEILLRGITPWLMHNGRLAIPTDPGVKQLKKLTAKSKKTDEDHEQIAWLEARLASYFDSCLGYYLPVEVLHKALHDSAKKIKLGKQVYALTAATDGLGFPVEFVNHMDMDAFLDDPEHVFTYPVVVSGRRVLRTRPKIPAGWTCRIAIEMDPAGMDIGQLEQIMHICGKQIGFGDWRPSAKVPGRMGRFVVDEFDGKPVDHE